MGRVACAAGWQGGVEPLVAGWVRPSLAIETAAAPACGCEHAHAGALSLGLVIVRDSGTQCMLITAVLFDIDGTLVDPVDIHAQAWADAFGEFGHHIPFDRIWGEIGKGGDQQMPLFLTADDLEQHGKALEGGRAEIFRARSALDMRLRRTFAFER
jgi:hypothetical protein